MNVRGGTSLKLAVTSNRREKSESPLNSTCHYTTGSLEYSHNFQFGTLDKLLLSFLTTIHHPFLAQSIRRQCCSSFFEFSLFQSHYAGKFLTPVKFPCFLLLHCHKWRPLLLCLSQHRLNVLIGKGLCLRLVSLDRIPRPFG